MDLYLLSDSAPAPRIEQARTKLPTLTDREKEVFLHILQGGSAKEIGMRLGISHRTVETHTDHIRIKLGLRRRVEMYQLCYSENAAHAVLYT